MINTVQKEFCCYCGESIESLIAKKIIRTVDHLVPISRGGNNTIKNKLPCCSKCNGEKGNKTIDQYIKFLEKEYKKVLHHRTRISLQSLKYKLEIKIENAKYISEYVRTAGSKLYKNNEIYKNINNKTKHSSLNELTELI